MQFRACPSYLCRSLFSQVLFVESRPEADAHLPALCRIAQWSSHNSLSGVNQFRVIAARYRAECLAIGALPGARTHLFAQASPLGAVLLLQRVISDATDFPKLHFAPHHRLGTCLRCRQRLERFSEQM